MITRQKDIKEKDTTEIEVLGRTIYGEARGEYKRRMGGLGALIAVGNVILNRVNLQSWFGKTIIEVCHKPWQFSCWNKDDPNYKQLMVKNIDDDLFNLCREVAIGIVCRQWPDLTDGADHYHNANIATLPFWAVNKIPHLQIGQHLFYRLGN